MDAQTALFQQHRPRLFGLAYRMLGTPGDAEDVLHDAWLRWHEQDTALLDDPEAWLVTVTTRLALDRLRRAKTERQHHVGPWLPEPLIAEEEEPQTRAERGESLQISFLLMLERLSAEERAAFLLHDIFDYSHAEAAAMLGIAEDACRQRAHRAKQRLREGRPRFTHAPEAQQRLLEKFMQAMQQPTPDVLKSLFADDVMMLADGGGRATAALRPLQGSDRVARLYTQIAARYQTVEAVHRLQWLNGAPALLTWVEGELATVMWIETDGEQIVAIQSLRDPLKLARLKAVTPSPGRAS
ncbi:RNA polymerase sigma factor SigJ [Dyella sp. GSA-30]|uniref:RNA polymerase sigma factor SigJ n=1 Tax=Dyella sp. GSA-30 TaxID=2994496 RepID=UPI00248FE75D|nr:RNA polymerase sigma factor SigJ [Dyella sp. GSA-30]BDU20960.1 sigma factor [Dyella sp. GSA-30]